ncbi:hypothetical protein LVB77_01570 [Lysobacter sp. 5GHs7-4]|uniref:hypothetical protein n=1 Tax=Lysobacter sp. 5GHs7-4 TaxID=2904253 RepID=UPI001E4A2B2E|nr:hypothetical protein [Lysobacter sp. 5GHs7-4]UHQ23430.1 hypothetical protein LVB77_01570 [Lysobacter sp. 5GHs7-4]
MGIEYTIEFVVPDHYDRSALQRKLPAAPQAPRPPYDYTVEPYGFCFVDHLVDAEIAALAFKRLIDEALRHGDRVQIRER